jgi:hypothetical protein
MVVRAMPDLKENLDDGDLGLEESASLLAVAVLLFT